MWRTGREHGTGSSHPLHLGPLGAEPGVESVPVTAGMKPCTGPGPGGGAPAPPPAANSRVGLKIASLETRPAVT